MDTLVDAGLVPDTSKWKYRPPPNVSMGFPRLSLPVKYSSNVGRGGGVLMLCMPSLLNL